VDGRTGKGIHDLLRRGAKVINAGKNEEMHERYDLTETTENLLEIFDEIQDIEERVLLKKTDVDERIAEANSKLKVNSPNDANLIDNISLKIDRLILHKYWGLLIFFLSMSLLFTSIFWLALPLMDLIDETFSAMASIAGAAISTPWLSDFVADGLISGLGSVIIFLPQIIILFLLLGLLEDSGYLARGAMLIDKPLSKIGLNGRSFVPMLSGFACAIPAMMAARTIPNKRERLLTIFILPLMSCSARLPVYALLIGFLLPIEQAWIGGILLASIYLFSIVSSAVIAGVINKFSTKLLDADDSSSFILELPTYKVPKLKAVFNNTLQSSWSYIKKAGPVILVFSAMLWFLTYFPNSNPQINQAAFPPDQIEEQIAIERVATSYAAELGKFIQPVMEPIGMDWRVGVSLISAFAAREVFVSSLALIFKVTGEDDEALKSSLISSMRNATFKDSSQRIFTPATVIGLIIFFVFALQCLSTVAVARQETGGWRIPLIQLGIYSFIAYGLMFVTVNGLRFIGIA
jgi:ferrous iron transport protein B